MDNEKVKTSRYVNLYPRTVCSILSILKNEGYADIESLLPCLKDTIVFLETIQGRGFLTIEDVISFIQGVINKAVSNKENIKEG